MLIRCPKVLKDSVAQLCELLAQSSTAQATMQVLLPLSEYRPQLVIPHFVQLKTAATETPTTITLAAQIMSAAGKVNKVSFVFVLSLIVMGCFRCFMLLLCCYVTLNTGI